MERCNPDAIEEGSVGAFTHLTDDVPVEVSANGVSRGPLRAYLGRNQPIPNGTRVMGRPLEVRHPTLLEALH